MFLFSSNSCCVITATVTSLSWAIFHQYLCGCGDGGRELGGGRAGHGHADTQLGQGLLELQGHRAVDEEVGGEVEHDQQVSHGLHAHHPEGWDIVVHMFDTGHLNI